MYIDDILKTKYGSICISCILWFGMASLFQKTCNSSNCIIIKGPSLSIKKNVYKINDKCYQYVPNYVSCKSIRSKTE